MKHTSLLLCLAVALALPARAEVTIDELVREAGVETGRVASRDYPRWREPKKILVRAAPETVADFRGLVPGVELVAVPDRAALDGELADADALLGFCSPEIVAEAPRLAWIQIFSAGAERCLAVDAVADGTILLTNMQKMASPVIGEHAIAMMLSLTRGLPHYARVMKDGTWDRDFVSDPSVMSVAGKTMLVVGLGGIGTQAAMRAAALGMEVVATRNSSREGPDFVSYVGLADELYGLAADADVVVNALPLTPETTDLFDEDFFDAVKPGAIFINVARGGSVVTEALVAALEDGRIAAAGLDVTDPEPLPAGHVLWRMDNVLITPHIAWAGNNNERELAVMRANLVRFVAGEPLYNVVNPELGY